MKTITNEHLNLFVVCAKAYLNMSPRSKLWYATDKILKIAIKKLKKVEDKKNEKRREFALTTDKGVYETTVDGQFKYTPDKHAQMMVSLLAIDEEVCEIPIHIIPQGEFDENPKFLSFDIRNAFEGIVIPEIDYENFDINSFNDKPNKP